MSLSLPPFGRAGVGLTNYEKLLFQNRLKTWAQEESYDEIILQKMISKRF